MEVAITIIIIIICIIIVCSLSVNLWNLIELLKEAETAIYIRYQYLLHWYNTFIYFYLTF